jgi:hypothetical protein
LATPCHQYLWFLPLWFAQIAWLMLSLGLLDFKNVPFERKNGMIVDGSFFLWLYYNVFIRVIQQKSY